jgi:hypothetical protein
VRAPVALPPFDPPAGGGGRAVARRGAWRPSWPSRTPRRRRGSAGPCARWACRR